MGLAYSTIFQRLSNAGIGPSGANPNNPNNTPSKIILTGLPNSGKSVILSRLKLGTSYEIPLASRAGGGGGGGGAVSTTSTNNSKPFCITLVDQKSRFYSFDLSPEIAANYYTDLRAYFRHSTGIIFVVDSSDRNSLEPSRKMLQMLLEDQSLQNCIFLILANKIDVANGNGTTTAGIADNRYNNTTSTSTFFQPYNHVMSAEKLVTHLQLDRYHDSIWKVVKTSGLTESGLYEALDWLSRTVERQREKEKVRTNIQEDDGD